MLKHYYIAYVHGVSSFVALVGCVEMFVKTQRHFLRKMTEIASTQPLPPEHDCLMKEMS